MKKQKIFYWEDIGSTPKIIKDDIFTNQDIGSNYISITFSESNNGKYARLIIMNSEKTKSVIYTGTILNGSIEFLLDEINLVDSIFYFMIKISDEKTTASSCLIKYSVNIIGFVEDVSLPPSESRKIEELLNELNDSIRLSNMNIISLNDINLNAENNVTILTQKNNIALNTIESLGSIDNVANETILNISEKINTAENMVEEINFKTSAANDILIAINDSISLANSTSEELLNENSVAGENIMNLSNYNEIGNTVIISLSNTITEGNGANIDLTKKIEEVPVKISEIEIKGREQMELVDSKGSQKCFQIESVGDDKIAAINKIPSGLNLNTKKHFFQWLGNQAEYDSEPFKYANTKYSIYDNDGSLLNQYYWKFMKPTDYYNSRISLVFQGGDRGLEIFNSIGDPILIDIAGGKTLEQCIVEETDDYVLYCDGEVATIENYVAGTYDLYLEKKKLLDSSTELIKSYAIEWNVNDDIQLLQDINKVQLEKLAQTPVELDDSVMPNLETRAIPMPISFCCRVDKKTRKIYIEDGYENRYRGSLTANNSIFNIDANGHIYAERTIAGGVAWVQDGRNYSIAGKYCVNYEVIDSTGFDSVAENNQTFSPARTYRDIKGSFVANAVSNGAHGICIYTKSNVGNKFLIKIIVTKGEVPKPFVKTVMPSGKLSFVTSANETTHTFLTKGGTVTFESGKINLSGEVDQLLVYKGVLTEQEKQTELAKTIRLKTNNSIDVF